MKNILLSILLLFGLHVIAATPPTFQYGGTVTGGTFGSTAPGTLNANFSTIAATSSNALSFSGTINGSTQVSGTVPLAASSIVAATATNSLQLGGTAAANYFQITGSANGAYVGQSGTSSELGPTSYLFSTFLNNQTAPAPPASQALYITYSFDGKSFNGFGPVYSPNNSLGQQLRDPSIVFVSGTFYVAYTQDTFVSGTASIYSTFGVVSSTDLVNWSLATSVDCSAIGGVTSIFAPEWFVDSDGSVHVTFTANLISAYEIHPTNAAMTTWSAPVALSLSGQVSDTYIIKTGTLYNIYCQRVPGSANLHYTSGSLTSGYMISGTTTAGGEGPCVIPFVNGTTNYRMFGDWSDSGPSGTIKTYDTADLSTNTFALTGTCTSNLNSIGHGQIAHGTVLPIPTSTLLKLLAKWSLNATGVASSGTASVTGQMQTFENVAYNGLSAFLRTNINTAPMENLAALLDKDGVFNNAMFTPLQAGQNYLAISGSTYTGAFTIASFGSLTFSSLWSGGNATWTNDYVSPAANGALTPGTPSSAVTGTGGRTILACTNWIGQGAGVCGFSDSSNASSKFYITSDSTHAYLNTLSGTNTAGSFISGTSVLATGKNYIIAATYTPVLSGTGTYQLDISGTNPVFHEIVTGTGYAPTITTSDKYTIGSLYGAASPSHNISLSAIFGYALTETQITAVMADLNLSVCNFSQKPSNLYLQSVTAASLVGVSGTGLTGVATAATSLSPGLSMTVTSGTVTLSGTATNPTAPTITGTGSASINFGIVATGFSVTTNVAVSGCSVGDTVDIGKPADGGQGIEEAWVSTSGTVSINSFAAIALTSTTQTYYFTTLRRP